MTPRLKIKINMNFIWLSVLLYDFRIIYSDGGGRSGVYLAIDANMELGEEEDAFDVFGYLKKLRQSRKGLIENLVST